MTEPIQHPGDAGITTLPSGGRIVKSSGLTSATGTLEEFMAHLGACRAVVDGHYNLDDILLELQRELCLVERAIGDPRRPGGPSPDWIEAQMKYLSTFLPQHTARIIPSGSPLATQIMIARAVVRRLERATIPLTEGPFFVSPSVLAWMNRCGDLLYIMARYANGASEYPEEIYPA